jgi:PAS domain S-box-containing protein
MESRATPEHPEGTLHWSDEVYRIAGYEPGSVAVTPSLFYELVHPADRELVRAAVAEAARTRSHYSIVHRLVRPNGEIRVVHETAHLFFDEETGEVVRMLGTAHDLTEQREIEHRFRQLAENIEEVFWLSTSDKQRLLYVSPSYETIWRRPVSEIYERPLAWMEAIHPDDRDRVRAAVPRQAAGDFSEEYRIVLPDGEVRWISDRAFPIRDSAGQVYRIAGVAMDITERKLTEIALARSNRSLQLLTACHEALIRAADENQLLREICDLAVTIGGYRMAWVGYALDDEGRTIAPQAWAGAESGYLHEIHLSWSPEHATGQGPAANAIRSGKAVVCSDITQNGFFWQQAASARGFRQVVCLPLRDDTGALGILALYSGEAENPSSAEVKLLQDLADDLAFGIMTIRSRLDRQRAQSVVLQLAKTISTKAGTEFFSTLTQSMVEAMGAKGGTLGMVANAERTHARTLSFYVDGKFMENVTYAVEGTPCAEVLVGRSVIHERDLQSRFPCDMVLQELNLHAYAGIPLLSPEGEVIGLMAVFFDQPIREGGLILSTLQIFAARAGAEIERQNADARIREQASLLDKARDAILVRDLDHRITYWNKSAERLYGWTAKEALGQCINRLLYRDDTDFRSAMAELLAAGEWNGELTQVNKAGETLIVECRWTLLHDEHGRAKSVLAINTDITERKKLESQFLRAQRMESIGTLAGGIAHDLNNVLAPILMSIELLRSPVDSRTHQNMLDTLESSAQRGADLVRQVLSFARGIEGQRVRIHPARVVDEVEKILRDTFPKNIAAHIHKAPDLWSIHGDPTQLHQVLVNLCVNARDAMAAGGELTVLLSNSEVSPEEAADIGRDARPGRYVQISVRDTGAGMPHDLLDKIFEPFFTTKPLGSGTGLGLSTTLAIVRSHGGFIQVESTLGEGSTFRVYLPSQSHPASAPEEPAGGTALPRGSGELVLIVDDEPSVRTVASRLLSNFGYRVELAANGADAVEIFRAKGAEVALVITDMSMPGMDGPTLIRALRATRPDLPILGSSGLSSQTEVETTTDTRISFLPKPYTTAELLHAVRAAMDPLTAEGTA